MVIALMFSARLAALSVIVATTACGHHYLPGTRIEETQDNHAIYDIIEDVRTGMELRDTNKILAHVSPQYFEDMGTPDQADDYGYAELKQKMTDTFASTTEMHVVLEIHAISIDGKHALADVRYASRARIELPSGGLWDAHREFNRFDFAREDNEWKIISGL